MNKYIKLGVAASIGFLFNTSVLAEKADGEDTSKGNIFKSNGDLVSIKNNSTTNADFMLNDSNKVTVPGSSYVVIPGDLVKSSSPTATSSRDKTPMSVNYHQGKNTYVINDINAVPESQNSDNNLNETN